MSNSRSERQTLISHLIAELDDGMKPEDFQREFFESLSEQFHRKFDLSDKQIDCLKRMYERVTGEDI